MIVIGIDCRMDELSWRRNHNEIFPLFDCRAHFTQFGGHCCQAIRLFYTPVVNVTNGRGTFGKKCRRRNRHRRIWDMVKIEIHRIQFTTASNHIIIAPLNLRAHLF
ncbi:Uncharacterised protein [Vibrio cholerae]|uniref:Uncharacterized protein n=1 Tax=Vibrio cholerae TaxID=666 RepID=A0A655PFB6_VIBCL|nr:Uncharacterised protein [Vibrio cholerae]CSA88855.1 Uncharacterised protein [Vibrio cholerae]